MAPTSSGDASRDWIAAFKTLLEGAERPVVLAGHGIRIAGAADQFRALAEKLGIPCTFTWNAADLLPFDHPLYVGRPGVVAARAPNFAIQNCDLLIAIGCRLDNIITAYNPKGFARAAKKIVVDVDAHELSRHEMAIDLPIEADAKVVIDTLLHENIDYRVPQNWAERCEDWKRRYPASEGRAATSGERMNHYAFCDVLSRSLKPNTNVITGSSGLAVEVFYTTFQNREGQRLFLTSGLGAMGYGVAAAIGACVGAGRKPTYCIESDGSLMMNIQELATLRAQSLPITVVVMNNGGYASIRNTQRNYFDSRFIGTDRESGLLIPDLVAIAQSFGLPAVDVSSEAELEAALEDAPTAGPRLINVHLARDEVLAPKVSALPQKDGSIISMPLEDMSPLLPLDVLQREMIVPLSEQSLRSRA
jgi:acetolactate synthase-1/2/3 large subunit